MAYKIFWLIRTFFFAPFFYQVFDKSWELAVTVSLMVTVSLSVYVTVTVTVSVHDMSCQMLKVILGTC